MPGLSQFKAQDHSTVLRMSGGWQKTVPAQAQENPCGAGCRINTLRPPVLTVFADVATRHSRAIIATIAGLVWALPAVTGRMACAVLQ